MTKPQFSTLPGVVGSPTGLTHGLAAMGELDFYQVKQFIVRTNKSLNTNTTISDLGGIMCA